MTSVSVEESTDCFKEIFTEVFFALLEFRFNTLPFFYYFCKNFFTCNICTSVIKSFVRSVELVLHTGSEFALRFIKFLYCNISFFPDHLHITYMFLTRCLHFFCYFFLIFGFLFVYFSFLTRHLHFLCI